jgi:hypothetical protein
VWQAAHQGSFTAERLKEMDAAEEERTEARVRALARAMGAISEDD